MKPHRLTLTNSLVVGYGLHQKMDHFFSPRSATQAELEEYHDPDYVDFLRRLSGHIFPYPRRTSGLFSYFS